ncbi:MAG: hypothetical protein RL662_1200 [Bacteroidota bacterium]|jgi:uncharacterized lipoprotein YddW (UPF0748 family)
MQRIYYTLLSVFISSLFVTQLSALTNHPATEIRAVWLTTNWNLDWPRAGLDAESQKRELRQLLDQLKQANFNTILFQARVRGDVFYKSRIEPMSLFFNKNTGYRSTETYDPLAFVIEECHKRGMECHAWLVTFPVGSQKQVKGQGSTSVVAKNPHLSKLHMGEWYLDPGHPEVKKYILDVVKEVVQNYDVDGIHFDYIRYPESAVKFPDSDTHRKHGKGKSLNNWRLDNITQLVSAVYDQIKMIKPWVQVSCSPLGRYRNLDPMRGKWTAYESVHQDAGKWMQLGKMDAIYPMLYYKEDDFGDYVDDWIKVSNGRFVVPGLGAYRLLPSEGNWSSGDIKNQLMHIEKSKAVGAAFYRTRNVLDNPKGVLDMLKNDFYTYPAKLPAMTWLDNTPPSCPINMQVYRNDKGTICIEWEKVNETENLTYTVYQSSEETPDLENPKNIIMTGIRGNKLYVNTSPSEQGVYFSVTASDRFHNESVACFPVYFILSEVLEK